MAAHVIANVQSLRLHALSQSLFTPAPLKTAIHRLGFVQADPIRAPARAQDLILRHRVKGYREGDLDRRYAALDLEEGVLYAYGFLPREIWKLRYIPNPAGLRALEQKVFEIVRERPEIHPRELEAHLGRRRALNAWGGYSKATTLALESLRGRGLLRIARRESGVRIYAATLPGETSMPSAERLRKLVMTTARILAPVPETSLQAALRPARRGIGDTRMAAADLVRAGELRRETIDGLTYVWPEGAPGAKETPGKVRFLAPFDPLVWDRRRFEHLWGWAYRFEAYTPAPRRVRGYYALPLLWRDQIIGWVNARIEAGRLHVEPGFVNGQPRDREFRRAFDAEVARLEDFLGAREN